jgi:hypothetical protein
MNTLHKSWQNKRPGWTRRVRWYNRADGQVRLCYEDDLGRYNVQYETPALAQAAFDQFKAGTR